MRTVRGMRIIKATDQDKSISKKQVAIRMIRKAKAMLAEDVKPVKRLERMLNAKK